MPPPSQPQSTGRAVQFRGQTRSRDDVSTVDTAVVVTGETVSVNPLAGVESDSALDFSVPLADITALRCEGMLCRAITLETDTAEYRIPTADLDETAFRNAILQATDLENSCTRLSLGQYGICLCGPGTYAGCLLTVAGLGMILSVVGAALGVLVAGAGVLLLAAVFLSRTISKWRGANVWERPRTGATA
ncbi:hypothetical protein HTSR_1568 [Halodesulfurarchaeum formicicum]|uniref:Uncharacterized protein n=1 Tax=Halodesulfurarchaeum formicicum TaxID=1873524 RepID=A0A1D8S5W1_9EURY|nr:hypothetical protein [Halodesulfurarchaeum formicicum]AOW80740.1 hypothetical protein HTSR_1568 [Halodesulfurarchaeum formicicum]